MSNKLSECLNLRIQRIPLTFFSETVGNAETMNLNAILYQNIIASPYFKGLYDKKTYHEVLDEVFNNEPFLKGTHASTAFCLLYKLWTLKLTVKQIEGLVDNADSPHIRAMGFIYLRYVCDPHELWAWFGDYLEDDEEVQIESGIRPRVVTIGKVVRDLIMESKWLGTILPRIPVSIARELEGKVKEVLGEGGKKSGPAASGPVGSSYGQGRGRGDDDYKRGDWAAGRGRGGDAGDDRRRGDGDRRRIDEDRRRDVDRRRGYDDEADLDYGDDNRRRRSRSPPARRYHDDGRYGRGDRGSSRDYEQSYGRGGYGGDRDAFSGRSREPQDARGGRSDYRSRSPPMRRSDDSRDGKSEQLIFVKFE
ncbi:hypothetical protein HDU77_006064 [Chytriomyces hyalinus]|nr:hypothetical protein HDU77_006064 [Chytriomyces hyalinus]